MAKLLFSDDKIKLLAHFKKDPVLFAYHMGDLDDFFFEMCKWTVLEDDNGNIEDVVLFYDHPKYPTVMAFGLTDRYQSLIADTLSILPDSFYCHYMPEDRNVIRTHYNDDFLGAFHKMQLVAYRKSHLDDTAENVVRLDSTYTNRLEILYELSYPEGYFDPRLLDTGKYLGYKMNDSIVAVAGVHVYSPEYKTAILGSIVTDVDFRGRGLSTQVTSLLVEELLAEGMNITLNVEAGNQPAIATYERIGFKVMNRYEEALFQRRVT